MQKIRGSPCLAAQEHDDGLAMRKGSSMIMGSAKGDGSLRERADSLSVFKKYDKVGGFNEGSKPFTSPDLSPGLMTGQYPNLSGLNPLATFGALPGAQNLMMQPNTLQQILM